jgi:predicted small integral membrane protein
MALYDLVALAIWLVLLPGLKRVVEERFDLAAGDQIFVSLVALVILELIWLRVGYGAP